MFNVFEIIPTEMDRTDQSRVFDEIQLARIMPFGSIVEQVVKSGVWSMNLDHTNHRHRLEPCGHVFCQAMHEKSKWNFNTDNPYGSFAWMFFVRPLGMVEIFVWEQEPRFVLTLTVAATGPHEAHRKIEI